MPSATSVARASAAPSAWTPPAVLLYFGVFALAHVIARVAVSPALKWDEAEQMLWSQQFAWGYGAQPPLYTWLQRGANAVFGPGVLALAVLKHGLLMLTYLFMWLTARRLLAPRAAWWAAASMVLIPALGWNAVRDQTHTVLVVCLVAGTWWAVLRQLQLPQHGGFALIGLFAGLGMLAKYNYALFAAALALAALSVPRARQALLAPGWWWAPLVALLVLLPHAAWLLGHLGEASAETLQKMQIEPEANAGRGLLELLKRLAATLLPWGVVALACFGRGWRHGNGGDARWLQAVFVRFLLLCGAALLAMVLVGGVSEFRERWLLPLFCVVPLAAFVARPQLAQARGGRVFGAVIVATAVLMLAGASARAWLAGNGNAPDELNHAVPELAAALQQAGYDGRGRIIAADHMLAGALRTRFPAAFAVACETRTAAVTPCVAAQTAQARESDRGWLLVSRADRLEPGWWSAALEAQPVSGRPQSLQIPFRHLPADAAPAHYQFIWSPAGGTP